MHGSLTPGRGVQHPKQAARAKSGTVGAIHSLGCRTSHRPTMAPDPRCRSALAEGRECPKSTPQLGHALSVENALRSVAGTATKARPSAVARPMRIDTPHTLTRWRVTSRSWAAAFRSAETLPGAQRRAAGTEPQKVCQSREQTEQQVKIVRAGTT